MERDDLTVVDVSTQDDLKNLWGRSVRLDILATDSAGVLYNIEVQRADKSASRKRARYNSSLLNSNVTIPREDYDVLKETHVIFIAEKDYLGKGLPLYHVERIIQETGELFGDDEHILYVNGQYRGDDPVGKMMHDFFCRNPEDINNKVLAQNVRYYKEDEKGVETMCRISEELWNEGRAEGKTEGSMDRAVQDVKNLMNKLKLSFVVACDALDLSKDERSKIEKLLKQ